jgi:hypothetical protein
LCKAGKRHPKIIVDFFFPTVQTNRCQTVGNNVLAYQGITVNPRAGLFLRSPRLTVKRRSFSFFRGCLCLGNQSSNHLDRIHPDPKKLHSFPPGLAGAESAATLRASRESFLARSPIGIGTWIKAGCHESKKPEGQATDPQRVTGPNPLETLGTTVDPASEKGPPWLGSLDKGKGERTPARVLGNQECPRVGSQDLFRLRFVVG